MSVDIVAIDVSPTIWAVYCEECESYIGEPNPVGEALEGIVEEHLRSAH